MEWPSPPGPILVGPPRTGQFTVTRRGARPRRRSTTRTVQKRLTKVNFSSTLHDNNLKGAGTERKGSPLLPIDTNIETCNLGAVGMTASPFVTVAPSRLRRWRWALMLGIPVMGLATTCWWLTASLEDATAGDVAR